MASDSKRVVSPSTRAGMWPFGLMRKNSGVRAPPFMKGVGTCSYGTASSSSIQRTRIARDRGTPWMVITGSSFRSGDHLGGDAEMTLVGGVAPPLGVGIETRRLERVAVCAVLVGGIVGEESLHATRRLGR